MERDMQYRPMADNAVLASEPRLLTLERPLQFLSARQIFAIDDALAAIGQYGEVRLIKNAGKLRFIQRVVSEACNNDQK
jgi:hypothetical protein